MLKKSVIVGLIFVLAGTAVLRWSLTQTKKERQRVAFYKSKYSSDLEDYLRQYNEWLQEVPQEWSPLPWGLDKEGKTKTEALLRQEQQERLKADMDKLGAGEANNYPFASILYGENWQEELRRYKAQEQTGELIFTASIVCTSIGGAIWGWCILLWMARLIIKGVSLLSKFLADIFRKMRKTTARKPSKADTKKDETEKPEENRQQEQTPHTHQQLLQRRSQILTNSGWQDFSEERPNRNESAGLQANASAVSRPKSRASILDARFLLRKSGVKETAESEPTSKTTTEKCEIPSDDSVRKSDQSSLADFRQDTLKTGDTLKAQAVSLEKHLEEFKQMAQAVRQTTIEHSEPLKNSLEELTEQVSAIREYASYQQDRVKKLQDGYDWNIIRNFCLRVIRCIDNLENRIRLLSEQHVDSEYLEEVRDELVFALESSGLEQFRPEINSDYGGQEKAAEAVKEKELCDDPNLAGKIAEVVRPGYQYFIDEDNVKIVRTAQVKLFG